MRDEYFVVWVRAYPASGTGNDIYGALLSWNGLVLSPPGVIAIDSRANDQEAPAVAVDAAGYYLVAWERESSSTDRDVCYQKLDGFGATAGGLAVWNTNSYDSRPVVTDAPGSHEWLVAWQTATDTGSAVSAYRWGPSFGHFFSVVDATFWEAANPAVAAGDATCLIAYEGDATGDPTVDRHIYGRIWARSAVFLPLVLSNG